MTFTSYLKFLLTDLVEQYRKHLRQTFGITVIFTMLAFVVIALLLKYSTFDRSVNTTQLNLLNYFFFRYSKGHTYSLVDLSKTVFIFFVSLYALGMTRRPADEKPALKHFLGTLSGRDMGVLTVTLLLNVLLDYLLFKLNRYFITEVAGRNTVNYLQLTIFHLRIYLPLIAFACALRFLTGKGKFALTLKTVLWLYVALWLYNEFAYELALWIQLHIFSLLFMPVDDPAQASLLTSIAGIPVTAFFFIGYYVAMTAPFASSSLTYAPATSSTR